MSSKTLKAEEIKLLKLNFNDFFEAVDNYYLEGTHDLTHPIINIFKIIFPNDELPKIN